MPLSLTCTTEEKIHVKLTPTTQSGKPAAVDGAPKWTVVSGAGTVVPDADGLGAFLLSTDEVDGVDTVFMVDADADLGPGVTDIQDTITLTTTNAQAKSLGLTADPAVSKV
jgi:hypothetical protein